MLRNPSVACASCAEIGDTGCHTKGGGRRRVQLGSLWKWLDERAATAALALPLISNRDGEERGLGNLRQRAETIDYRRPGRPKGPQESPLDRSRTSSLISR